jgi:GTPase SAR1 family protein
MDIEQNKHIFKIVVVGHPGVGKTSLITKYINNIFKTDYNVTIGVEFYTKRVTIDK